MSPWQVLRAGRVSRAALCYVHHGPVMSVHYSTATTTSAAPESSRTFCLSKDKLTMQHLNRRLTLYLQQVLCLQMANHRLEHQIKEVLNRICPRELKEIDGHLRTASVLQDQISECLTAQAHMKMQLLDAELNIFNFTARCAKVREHREHLEKELSNLRLQEEELKANKLPELQSLLNSQTQQLAELQIQHQQGIQGLLARVSGGIGLEMQTAESSDLVQQLDDLRQLSTTLHIRNEHKCCLDTQVSMLKSPEMRRDSSVGSEFVHDELEALRRAEARLEEELTQMQALNILLEASSLEQTESFDLQLLALQQRADSLCRELDSVLQAAAQHTANHQNLLVMKNQLETEMQDYRKLLAKLSHNGHINYRRQAPRDRTVCVQGENHRTTGVPRGLICAVGQAPVVSHITIIQLPVTVQVPLRKHSNNLSEIKTSDLIESLHMPAKQQTGALPKITKITGRESMTLMDAMINRQSSPVASKMEINAAQGTTMLVHDELSATVAAVQVQPETFSYNGPTQEIGLQANKTDANIQTEIFKAKCGAKAELKEELYHGRQMASTDPSKESAAGLKTERGNVILHQTGSVQDKKEDADQIMSYSLRSRSETGKAYKPSGSHHCRPSNALVEISSELTIVDNKGTSQVLSLDQSSALSDESNSKPNKVLKVKDARSCSVNNAFSGLNSNSNFEGKTAGTEERVEVVVSKENCFHETIKVKVTPADLNNLVGTEELFSPTELKNSASLTDSGVALSLSDLEELPSPTETDVFLSPTKTCFSPEICPHLVETEELIGLTGQVFCTVYPEDHGSSADLSINDPEAYPSPNDTEKCLSPVMTEGSSSPKGEEDREASLILKKGKAQVRPVEKYTLSTNKEQQFLEFCGEPALTEGEKYRTVTISVTEGDSLCFGSFEDNESRSRSLGGLGFRGPACISIVADKKEPLDNDPFYWKNVRDVRTHRDSKKNNSSDADNNKEHKETTSMGSALTKHSQSIAACNSDVAVGLAANFSGTITKSSGVVNSAESAVAAVVQGRFGHENRGWMVYGGGPGHKSHLYSDSNLNSEGTKEGPSVAIPTRCLSETGRFGRRGNGEWYVYRSKNLQGGGSLPREGEAQSMPVAINLATTNSAETGKSDKRESRGFNLLRIGSEESRATDMLPASSQQGTGRFDSRINEEGMQMSSFAETSPNREIRRSDNQGSGKWMVNSSDSFSRERKESLPTTTNMATSPPGTGRFGSSGEWRVYGRNIGFLSKLTGSNAKSEESPSLARELATSAGWFGTGEWRVYGGNNGQLNCAGGADRINGSADEGQKLSSPNSYTHRGPRLSSTESGGRLSSGSVVRRCPSVDSSGRLSSSGSGGKLSPSPTRHRIRSSEKPIYRSASGSRNSVGYARQPTGGRTTSVQTPLSPRGRTSANGGSSGGLSSSTNGGIRISSTGSMSQVSGSGSKDRISSPVSGGFSSSSERGRANSTGGRVINSSDWLKRSPGCGAKGNKEKICICKMAALSISAAGRERSQERRRPT